LITEEHLKEMGIVSVGHRILLIRRFADIINGKLIQKPISNKPVWQSRTLHKPQIDMPVVPTVTSNSSKQEVQDPSKRLHETLHAKKVESRALQEDHFDDDRPFSKILKNVSSSKREEKYEERELVKEKVGNEEIVEELVRCQYCGRKFKPDAAKRHIPVCGRINQGRENKK
jgi:rubrerythrin